MKSIVSENQALAALLAVGLVVRVAALILCPSLDTADENFQSLEQAHRLAFGYGIKPWEFDDGIRSLVLPGLISLVMRATVIFSAAPETYIFTCRFAFIIISLLPIISIFRLGLVWSLTHAILGATVFATWFEAIYFSPRPLSEAIAASFLISAACEASRRASLKKPGFVWIGFLLAMALCLRIQFAPGVFVIACFAGRNDLRCAWTPMVLGGLTPLLIFGIADWVTWGAPFSSYWNYVRINLFEGKASHYGIRPAYWYLGRFIALWSGVLPILFILIILFPRKYIVLLATAITLIVANSLIAHKEYRYIFVCDMLLIEIAAFASADIFLILHARLFKPNGGRQLAGVAGLWVLTSLSLAFAPGFRDNWYGSRELISFEFTMYRDPSLCGVLLYDEPWGRTGGYAYLHRNVPIYSGLENEKVGQENENVYHISHVKNFMSMYNYIIAEPSAISEFAPQFDVLTCWPRRNNVPMCLLRHPGSCTPDPALVPLLEQHRLGEL
jgi:phosphatidylinositol glycan class B